MLPEVYPGGKGPGKCAHRDGVTIPPGLSPPRISLGGATVPTAAAVGEQLVGFLEAAPGASPPRDLEHLRRQELVIATAQFGGWACRPEAPLVAAAGRPRSIDVLLERQVRHELGIVEIWDYLDDVGAAMRSLDEKQLLLAAAGQSDATRVGALWVVRGTRRNRELVAAYPELFCARFPASSTGWLAALVDPHAPMPGQPGLMWTDVPGKRLIAWHRSRTATRRSGPG